MTVYFNRYAILLLLSSFFWIQACSNSGPKTYKLEEKWIHVLMDLYAYQVIIESTQTDLKDSLSAVYKSQIAEIHNLTEMELDAFTESLADDPDLAVQYYDEAIKRWDQMEQELTEDHHTEN